MSGPATWGRLLWALGPGVVAMLADTDAGSVLTAGQSGAEWGYRLLLPQFLMIPLLYATQEMTTRLALATGKGLSELTRLRFGPGAAGAAFAAMAVSCLGALVTQLAALGALAQTLGLPGRLGVLAATGVLLAAGLGAFERVERVAVALGLFELAFFIVAWKAGPKGADMAAQMIQAPLSNPRYLYLAAANIGTTFLPWAILYQQSATAAKGLTLADLRGARMETLAGAILCQAITAAILVAAAASGGAGGDVGALAQAFARTLGPGVGVGVFALGLIGSATVAGMVAALAFGWSLRETFALKGWAFAAYAGIVVAAAAFVLWGANSVSVSLAAGAVNAALLPLVLGLLYLLALRELKGPLAYSPAHAWVLGAAFFALAALSLYTGLVGLMA